MKEPRILLIGRLQSTLDVLTEELRRYGRDIFATNNRSEMERLLLTEQFDFAVIGGGLDDESRNEIVAFVKSLIPQLPVYLVPRTPGASPTMVIPFVNELAVLFKVSVASIQSSK